MGLVSTVPETLTSFFITEIPLNFGGIFCYVELFDIFEAITLGMEEILTTEWFIASASLASGFIVRMIFDRRKLQAENDSAQLDADTKAVELYERYVSRLQPEIDALKVKQEQLTEAISLLRIENANLKIENAELKAENSKLHTEVQGFNQQIENLKMQISKKNRP